MDDAAEMKTFINKVFLAQSVGNTDVSTSNLRTFVFSREDIVEFHLLEFNLYVVIADVNDVFCLSSFASSSAGLLVLKLCGKVYFI